MRSFEFPITKAAHKRFMLLGNNANLSLPLSDEQISPFGFRLTDMFFMLTHEGKDVAYVSNTFTDDQKSVLVFTPTAKSDVVDAAIVKTLRTVTEHLNVVNRASAQENRERLAREKEIREAQEAEIAKAREIDHTIPFRGEDTAGRIEVSEDDMNLVWQSGFPPDEVISVDPISYQYEGNIRHASYRVFIKGQSNVVKLDYVGGFYEIRDNNYGLSTAKLNAHLQGMADWARDNNDPQAIADSLMSLPPADLSIISYVLSKNHYRKECSIGLPHDVTIDFIDDNVFIKRRGAQILHLTIPSTLRHVMPHQPAAIPERSEECFGMSNMQSSLRDNNASLLSDEHYQRLGSAWIHAIAAADPTFDVSPYAPPDMERLEDAAMRMDAGY